MTATFRARCDTSDRPSISLCPSNSVCNNGCAKDKLTPFSPGTTPTATGSSTTSTPTGTGSSLQGSAALSLCTNAQPLHTRIANIFGTSLCEATMRPNPRSSMLALSRVGPHLEGKIHRVGPDFGSTLTAPNRDSQSNRWANWKIMGQPCEFQVWGRGEGGGRHRPSQAAGES
jgi:hypothetical protein